MSSPLKMLKKTRRTPLQGPVDEQRGRQTVPFKRNPLKEFQSALAADDGAPPSDFELMSAMMQRVKVLERTLLDKDQEIISKDKRISTLEKKLSLLKESESTHAESGRDIIETCQQLQKQVNEMESFLNDYGMIWVGDDGSSDVAESERQQNLEKDLWQPEDASVVRSFHMNFDLVLQKIRELNILAGDGECFVESTATRAHLARKDPIKLSLYGNGIVMFDGPFRSYQEHSTQQCMQDLMDGYFPSELQERFPDGVPFEVHDRRDEKFISRPLWNTFPGEGKAVGGKKDRSLNAVSSQLPGRKLSVDQFLNRLPKVVVKAGRVIDIRDSLRTALQGSSGAQSSDSVILIDTPALEAMERLQISARDVITLKVKSEDGNHTYILKMCFSETIGNLRQHLDKHRGAGLAGYDIISVCPRCRYDDDGQTLQSCGLTTNATLLLRRRKHPQSLTEADRLNL